MGVRELPGPCMQAVSLILEHLDDFGLTAAVAPDSFSGSQLMIHYFPHLVAYRPMQAQDD